MKRVAFCVFIFLSLMSIQLIKFSEPVSAQAVIFASPTPAAADPLVIDCAPNSLSDLSVFMPPNLNRDDPSGIRIVSAGPDFRGKRVLLWFRDASAAGAQKPLGPDEYQFAVNIDASGNADLTQQTLGQLAPFIPEGEFTFSVRGGPIYSRNPVGEFPVCFTQTSYNVVVAGGTNCLKTGDICQPGVTQKLCNEFTFCNPQLSPPRIMLPSTKAPILGGAKCEYVSTPKNVTCAQAKATLPIACGDEITAVIGDGDAANSPVGEQTMCCESQEQCNVAKGGAPPEVAEQLTAFNACRQIAVPQGATAAERAATQSKNRDECCMCMTGNQSSYFIEAKQSCLGEDQTDAAELAKAGIYTAVGCISQTPEGIVARLVRIGLGLSGGVALLMILAGGFMFTTSQGDPKRAGEAKELVTSAVMGILFIIFSVTILQFIGVSVLQIPGFGG